MFRWESRYDVSVSVRSCEAGSSTLHIAGFVLSECCVLNNVNANHDPLVLLVPISPEMCSAISQFRLSYILGIWKRRLGQYHLSKTPVAESSRNELRKTGVPVKCKTTVSDPDFHSPRTAETKNETEIRNTTRQETARKHASTQVPMSTYI